MCFESLLISGLFLRSPSYTAAVQGQERKRHTVACVRVFVCAACMCLDSGNGPNLSETSPRTTRARTIPKSHNQHKLPPWSSFLPATASAESPAVSKTHPRQCSPGSVHSPAKNFHQRLKQWNRRWRVIRQVQAQVNQEEHIGLGDSYKFYRLESKKSTVNKRGLWEKV